MLSVIKNIRDHLMDEGLDCVRFLSGISKPRVLVLLSVRNKSMNCSLMTSALIFINSCISQLCLVSNDRYRLCHSCVESSQHLQSINAVNSRCNLNTISIRMQAPVHWGTSCHGWKSAPQQPTHANKSITIKEDINIKVVLFPRWRFKTLARRQAIARGRTANLATRQVSRAVCTIKYAHALE